MQGVDIRTARLTAITSKRPPVEDNNRRPQTVTERKVDGNEG